MDIIETKGNALDFACINGHALIHCCNAQGKMGTGIAKQVRDRFPKAYFNYKLNHSFGSVTADDMNNISVINLVAQKYYGNDGRRYVDYDALTHCLKQVAESGIDDHIHTIVVPKFMGCGLAGGDWGIVSDKIIRILGGKFNLTIVEYRA